MAENMNNNITHRSHRENESQSMIYHRNQG